MSRRAKILLLTLLLSLATPATAGAEELLVSELTEQERAELGRLFTDAQRAFEREDYDRAVRNLEQAFEIFPEPNILYRIGDAYERSGRFDEAVEYYTRYVEAAADAEDLPMVHRHIAELKKYIEQDTPAEAPPKPAETKSALLFIDSTPAGAQVYIGDEPAPRALTPARIRVQPGKTPILLKADGHRPLERTLRVEAGETLAMVYPLQAQKMSAPAASESTSGPWVLGGLGVASLATGAGLLIASNSATSQLETYDRQRLKAHKNGDIIPSRPANYDDLKNQEYYFSRTGWALVGVGAVGIGAGVAWLMLSDREDAEVALVPGWGGLSLNGRF